MSSRYYPIYQIGNPQLRIFLPNFWMKLVKPTEKQPPNVVQFKVPLAMTNYDIKNYLQKIYKISVMHVSSELEDGLIKPVFKNGYLVKEEDFRRAYVTLPRGTEFIFPELDCEEIKTKSEKEKEQHLQELEASYKKHTQQIKGRFGLPTWFTI
ncbi:hypothetical protein PGB90_002855 [Kerria lacca]